MRVWEGLVGFGDRQNRTSFLSSTGPRAVGFGSLSSTIIVFLPTYSDKTRQEIYLTIANGFETFGDSYIGTILKFAGMYTETVASDFDSTVLQVREQRDNSKRRKQIKIDRKKTLENVWKETNQVCF